MLNPILLTLGMLSTLSGPPSHSPPLCRVIAAGRPNPFFPLRTVTVTLRPDCPRTGHAWVRLISDLGATDPVYDWVELTPSRPSKTFLGVLDNWHPEWQAASGATYRVPETPRSGP